MSRWRDMQVAATFAAHMPPDPSHPLRTTASGRRAEEWALVLTSEGIGAGF